MRGTIHLERDELEEALDALDLAVTLDPGYPAALLNRAVAYYGRARPSARRMT
jgi:lipoprotein NlpI